MMKPPGLDDEQQYQAAISKDARFDGVFFIAVSSTGIYCRPSCPAITPKRENMRYYRTAAAAQEAGYRACKRCRPDASPGSPEWNIRADVVGRAVRRLVTAELGAGPLAIARAQRAQAARVLTETTALPLSEIAFAAGFASIRQFNATMHEVFAMTPTQLRAARGTSSVRSARPGPGAGAGSGSGSGSGDPAAASPPGLIRL